MEVYSFTGKFSPTLLHSERPKLLEVLAVLCAKESGMGVLSGVLAVLCAKESGMGVLSGVLAVLCAKESGMAVLSAKG